MFSRISPPGFCSRCYGWLGNSRKITEDIEQYRVTIEGIGDLIAVTPQLQYKPIFIELTRKLELILLVLEEAIKKDFKLLGELGKIIEQLRIAVRKNQDKPYYFTKLIIPACYQANIRFSQLLLLDFKELSEVLLKSF